jgi:hypothetical protein
MVGLLENCPEEKFDEHSQRGTASTSSPIEIVGPFLRFDARSAWGFPRKRYGTKAVSIVEVAV